VTPVPAREPTSLVYRPSNLSPHVNTDTQETIGDGSRKSPRYSFRQLDRHMNPLTLKSTNSCQIGVMRLDQLSDRFDSPEHSGQSLPRPSETSRCDSPIASSPSTPPPTEFLSYSAQSPSIGLSSLPSGKILDKPLLACLFCRGRKIACGAPLPGSVKKTCKSVLPFSFSF
jgi:hypothetical protein